MLSMMMCSKLQALVREAYDMLGLQTYFTSGGSTTDAADIIDMC